MINLRADARARPVSWRWQRAQFLRENGRGTNRRQDDTWVVAARRFQVALAACRTPWDHLALSDRNPAFYEAREIWAQEGARGARWELEARLLAIEETTENISRRLCVTPDVVRTYEALFFNVKDRLDNQGWVVHDVLGRSLHAGFNEREYDLIWKLFGYFYGPVALDGIIDTFVAPSRPTSADRLAALYDDDTRASIRRKAMIAARTLPVNSFTQPAILEIAQKYLEMEKAAGGAGGGTTQMLVTVIGDMMSAVTSTMTVGGGTAERPLRRDLLRLDAIAAEPRAGELAAMGAGMDPGIDDETMGLRFPEATNGTNG